MSALQPLVFLLWLLYHESAIHDRHSPLAECASPFFSLTLIISSIYRFLHKKSAALLLRSTADFLFHIILLSH